MPKLEVKNRYVLPEVMDPEVNLTMAEIRLVSILNWLRLEGKEASYAELAEQLGHFSLGDLYVCGHRINLKIPGFIDRLQEKPFEGTGNHFRV